MECLIRRYELEVVDEKASGDTRAARYEAPNNGAHDDRNDEHQRGSGDADVRAQGEESRAEGEGGGHADEGPEKTTIHVLSIVPIATKGRHERMKKI
jgi:hypothetical protein